MLFELEGSAVLMSELGMEVEGKTRLVGNVCDDSRMVALEKMEEAGTKRRESLERPEKLTITRRERG